jgi:hypothetical protein
MVPEATPYRGGRESDTLNPGSHRVNGSGCSVTIEGRVGDEVLQCAFEGHRDHDDFSFWTRTVTFRGGSCADRTSGRNTPDILVRGPGFDRANRGGDPTHRRPGAATTAEAQPRNGTPGLPPNRPRAWGWPRASSDAPSVSLGSSSGLDSACRSTPSCKPLRLKAVRGRTITAKPFADFAVAADSGVWVSGVAPGAVLYDGPSGAITARARIPGGVGQALEVHRGEVLVPTLNPSLLLRLDQGSGAVQARVKLPANPIVESAVGAEDGTAFVLVDPAQPTIAMVSEDGTVDSMPAPEGASALRAGYGSLWVPTDAGTVERYSLEAGTWSSIGAGPFPRFLDVGYGAVWVMNQGDGSVTRIDGRSGKAITFPVTGEQISGGDLTTGAGAVWLRTDSSVLRIDPRTRRVTHWIELPPGSGSVAAVRGSLWITNHDHLAVHRVPLPLPG